MVVLLVVAALSYRTFSFADRYLNQEQNFHLFEVKINEEVTKNEPVGSTDFSYSPDETLDINLSDQQAITSTQDPAEDQEEQETTYTSSVYEEEKR